ncbi:hypothetical protein AYI69_g689 [Smittium culicis]|uniref:Uncharacterized protein n=1 Tax=Smittium culicis TaxID=133412 RepID=A0A1R1YSM8_9FUNG|nr:hypothetical protein AYI69_g689 [Smittium culicis]
MIVCCHSTVSSASPFTQNLKSSTLVASSNLFTYHIFLNLKAHIYKKLSQISTENSSGSPLKSTLKTLTVLSSGEDNSKFCVLPFYFLLLV